MNNTYELVNRLLANAHRYRWSEKSRQVLARKQVVQRKWRLARSILRLAATQQRIGWK